MRRLIDPHGGKLKNLLVDKDLLEAETSYAKKLPIIRLNSLEISDFIMIATGAFSPLEGFMNSEDYYGVLGKMKLSDGVLWPIPVTLSVGEKEAKNILLSEEYALMDEDSGIMVGKILVDDKYPVDKVMESSSVFYTSDENHPGVTKLRQKGEINIGGRIMAFNEGIYPERFPEYSRPAETRELFAKKGWRSIVAFQTRNPIHRSHEYLTKVILETYDGLFIHPIVGKLKDDDIPADIRMKCYKTLIDNYYPKDRVVLKVYPMEMRYAGPKEAILHAIIRQNYGCTHIIIGRDHAGVGKYYGPFDAQKIFETLSSGDLAIKPVCMDWTFYCSRCKSMASYKSCPHPDSDHILISGTKLRDMLSQGQYPPDYITRKEVSDILIEYYKNIKR